MDFAQVLRALLEGLQQAKIRYGVIGGFALGALGAPRATVDLDLLVHQEDLGALHQVLTSLGYTRDVHTENVSHYRHKEGRWGAIDVLHAFRTFALGMLERARILPVLGGAASLRVLEPEDIIGLKVQAAANNPLRQLQETADIEALMAVHGKTMNWTRLQEYYALFDRANEVAGLRARFGHAQ